jgi:hypothetical protein
VPSASVNNSDLLQKKVRKGHKGSDDRQERIQWLSGDCGSGIMPIALFLLTHLIFLAIGDGNALLMLLFGNSMILLTYELTLLKSGWNVI